MALATDVNPGGGFSPSMPFAIALACFGMDMTFEEALVAATFNGAWSLDRRGPSRQPRSRASWPTPWSSPATPINLIRMGAPVDRRGVQAWGVACQAALTISEWPHETDRAIRVRAARGVSLDPSRRRAEDRPRRSRARSAPPCSRWSRPAETPRASEEDSSACRLPASAAPLSRTARGPVDEDSDAYDRVVAAFRLPKVGRRESGAQRTANPGSARRPPPRPRSR